jgi:phosphoribosylformylglycinamidine cyclo-ligase
LARKIFFEKLKWKPDTYVPELRSSIAEELLKIHVSYGPLTQSLLQKFNAQATVIKGLAHITGGGFVDNIPRILPKRCDAVIRQGAWPVLPIFDLIAQRGHVAEDEMFQVFNMGIGMVMVVAAEKAGAALAFIGAQKHSAWIIGEIAKGTGQTVLS